MALPSLHEQSRLRRRLPLAVLASFALHLLPAAMSVVRSLHLPAPPIPIEIRTVRRPAMPLASPQPPAPPPSEEKPAPPPKPGAGPAKIAKKRAPAKKVPPPPPPPPPPATADLRPFAPGDAKVMVLVRTDCLRSSPHKAGAGFLLSSFPDYATLFEGSGLDPIADLDALLIATPNAFDVTATFLAARHGGDGRVRAALAERKLPVSDPRVFRFPEPTLTIYSRWTLAIPAPDPPPDGGALPVEDPKQLEARWIDGLKRFEQVADGDGTPAVLVTIEALDSLIKVGDGLPTPLALSLAMTAEASPAVRVRLVFASESDAAALPEAWPGVLARWRASTSLVGLAAMFDDLRLTPDHETLEIAGRLPEAQVRTALSLARVFLSRPKPGGQVAGPMPPTPMRPPPMPAPAPSAPLPSPSPAIDAGVRATSTPPAKAPGPPDASSPDAR